MEAIPPRVIIQIRNMQSMPAHALMEDLTRTLDRHGLAYSVSINKEAK